MFPVNGEIGNIFSFADCRVCVLSSQFRSRSLKTAMDTCKWWAWLCRNKSMNTGGQTVSHILPTPFLNGKLWKV